MKVKVGARALGNSVFHYVTVSDVANIHNATIGGLTPFTDYEVIAIVVVGDTDNPPVPPLRVKTAEGVPSQPLNLEGVVIANTNNIQLTWQRPHQINGHLRRYMVYYHRVSTGAPTEDNRVQYIPFTRMLNLSDLSLTVFKLSIGHVYEFWVTAYTDIEGPPSKRTTVALRECAISSCVQNLNKSQITDNSVQLTWSPPPQGAIATSYVITYDSDDIGELTKEVQADGNSAMQYSLDGLSQGSDYYVTIKAKNNCGSGPSCGSLSFGTTGDPLPAPTNMTVDQADGSKLTVKWKVSPIEDSWVYTLYYDTQPSNLEKAVIHQRAMKKENIAGTQTELLLLACQDYFFRVQISGPKSVGLLSDPFHGNTDIDHAAPPKNVKAHESHVDKGGRTLTVTVTWDASCALMSEETNYVIIVVEEDQKNKRNKTEQQILVPTTSLTFDISHNISLFKRGAVYYISVKRVEEEFQTRAAPFFRLHVGQFPAPNDFIVSGPNIVTTFGTEEKHIQWDISWTRPKGLPDGESISYDLLHAETDRVAPTDADVEYTIMGVVNDTHISIQQLDPKKTHLFKVRVSDVYGYPGKETKAQPTYVFDKDKLAELLKYYKPNTGKQTGGGQSHSLLLGTLIPGGIVIFILLLLLGVYMVRHRRLQRSFLSFANSHYDTRSGTTTISTGDDLDEDEDSPMIRGFSDDEPLVIA